jgi:hypothetical protein
MIDLTNKKQSEPIQVTVEEDIDDIMQLLREGHTLRFERLADKLQMRIVEKETKDNDNPQPGS